MQRALGRKNTHTENSDLRQPPNMRKLSQNIERNRLIPDYVMDSIMSTYTKEKNRKRELEQASVNATEHREQMQEPVKQRDKQLSIFDEFGKPNQGHNAEEAIGIAATQIAHAVNSNCIVSIERSARQSEDEHMLSVKIAIFRKRDQKSYNKLKYETKMSVSLNGSVMPIKELLIEAIKLKYISKGDRIVCVGDESVGMGYKGMIFIFDVDKVFFNMSTQHLTDKIRPEVLEAVLDIGLEIGREGREGRKVGTGFIIGNKQEILRYSKQLIINPFLSYPEERRNVSDPLMRETIKGFSQLDGVFMVDEAGTLISAGTLINVNMDGMELSSLEGFGTRHRCCGAITKLVPCIAVVVSGSGGTVRVLKEGKIVMKLP